MSSEFSKTKDFAKNREILAHSEHGIFISISAKMSLFVAIVVLGRMTRDDQIFHKLLSVKIL